MIFTLLRVAFPLILSLFSSGMMLLVDRYFLAQHSIEAMNGLATANLPLTAFFLSAFSLTTIAQVFVGQYNGQKEFHKIGQPVWQMIYFSLFTIPLFFLLTVLGESFLFVHSPVREEALTFYRTLMFVGFLWPLQGALSSFFVGRGKTFFVLFTSLSGNGSNILLNIFLIPSLGILGAALATLTGQFIQCLILFTAFLSKKNRAQFSTHDYRFRWSLFKENISIGAPSALDRFVNILAWTVYTEFVANLGLVPLTIITITQSMLFAFTFISQAISRAVSSVAANCIGAGDMQKLAQLKKSALFLLFSLFLFYGIFFQIFPIEFASLFLTNAKEHVAILEQVQIAATFVWIAVLVDSLRWLWIGLLTAAGDTRYVMWVGSISIWLLAILPQYILLYYFEMPVIYSWLFSSLYYAVVSLLYATRFARRAVYKPLVS